MKIINNTSNTSINGVTLIVGAVDLLFPADIPINLSNTFKIIARFIGHQQVIFVPYYFLTLFPFNARLTAEFSRLEKRGTTDLWEKCQVGWIEPAFQARLQRDVRRFEEDPWH